MHMRNKQIAISIYILSMLFAFVILLKPAVGGDALDLQQVKAQMKEYMALDDLEDESALAQQQRILELGSSAYPVLAELLDETEEAVAIGRILGVFVEGKGDKQIAIGATKKLLGRNPDKSSAEIRILAVITLAKIGNPKDVDAMIPLIGDSSEFVRVNVMRALSRLGNTNELSHIEQYLALREAQTSKDDLQKDLSFHEGQMAVESIKRRLAETMDR